MALSSLTSLSLCEGEGLPIAIHPPLHFFIPPVIRRGGAVSPITPPSAIIRNSNSIANMLLLCNMLIVTHMVLVIMFSDTEASICLLSLLPLVIFRF